MATDYDPDQERPLDVVSTDDALAKIDDLVIFGNPDAWQLLGKVSSKSLGLMKSTKAVDLGEWGCLVQVTTELTDQVAEALVFTETPIDVLKAAFEAPAADPEPELSPTVSGMGYQGET